MLQQAGTPVARLGVPVAPADFAGQHFLHLVAVQFRAPGQVGPRGTAGEPPGLQQDEGGEKDGKKGNDEQTAPLHGLTPCPLFRPPHPMAVFRGPSYATGMPQPAARTMSLLGDLSSPVLARSWKIPRGSLMSREISRRKTDTSVSYKDLVKSLLRGSGPD